MILEGPDARHLALVRRARPGERIGVSDGKGEVVEAAIESVSRDRVEAAIVEKRRIPRPAPVVTVLQGLARRSKIDFAVGKLAELGVDRTIVFSVSRSVPKWDHEKRIAMLQRWEKIAYESSKQSHRAWLPEVEGPLSLEAAVDSSREQGLCLVAAPISERSIRSVLPPDPPASLGLVVGPEGGLDESEIERFHSAGGVPVSLGGQILRTETAGLAMAAVCMFHFGRLG